MTFDERMEKIAVLQQNFSKILYRDTAPETAPIDCVPTIYKCGYKQLWYETFDTYMAELVSYLDSIDVEKYLPDYLFDIKVGMFPHSLLKKMPVNYIVYRCSGDYLEMCLRYEEDIQDRVINAVERVQIAIELLRVRLEICRLKKEAEKLAKREAELQKKYPFFL